jgi:hypothetical protein
VNEWVKEHRFDMYAEVLSTCGGSNAVAVADLIFPIQKDITDAAEKAAGLTPGKLRVQSPDTRLAKEHPDNYLHLAEPEVALGSQGPGAHLVRADILSLTQARSRIGIFAVRSELRDPSAPPRMNLWDTAIVLVNNSTRLQHTERSLIVVDEDIDLGPQRCALQHTVVIANGEIRAPATCIASLSQNHNVLCATKDIRLPSVKPPTSGSFHAGRSITFAGKVDPNHVGRVREKQKELPFGVKFLDPEEFGLELVSLLRAGVIVKKVAEKSVFASYDVRAGDIIAQANGVHVDSVATFRRQLRRGVIDESMVLEIVRGGKTVSRIIFLDGISKP